MPKHDIRNTGKLSISKSGLTTTKHRQSRADSLQPVSQRHLPLRTAINLHVGPAAIGLAATTSTDHIGEMHGYGLPS